MRPRPRAATHNQGKLMESSPLTLLVPRDTDISMSSGSTTKRLWLEGLMRGCTFDVPRSGRYTVEAWLEAVGTAPGWSVDEPMLILKLQ